jgi:hypothetical protein
MNDVALWRSLLAELLGSAFLAAAPCSSKCLARAENPCSAKPWDSSAEVDRRFRISDPKRELQARHDSSRYSVYV